MKKTGYSINIAAHRAAKKSSFSPFLRIAAMMLMLTTSVGLWGQPKQTFYAKVTTEVTPTGSGNAYISTSSTVGNATEQTTSTDKKNTTVTFFVKAIPASHYEFVRWEFTTDDGERTITDATSAETSITVQTHKDNDKPEKTPSRQSSKLRVLLDMLYLMVLII